MEAYKKWVSENQLSDILKKIKQAVSVASNETAVASMIGISLRTFQSYKNKYKDFENAYTEGKELLKESLISSLYKRAIGMKVLEEDQYIEETSRGKKMKVVKHYKEIPPDPSTAKYLLVLNFGRDYLEKKYELEMMEKRIEESKEEWSLNANNIQETR